MIYVLSILNGEFVKIGYTNQPIKKRIAALQTGNPHPIEVMFTVDGSIEQEQHVHRALNMVFERIKVFSNPINEWYSGHNPIIKMFVCNMQNAGVDDAINSLNKISKWGMHVSEEEIFAMRTFEKVLRQHGFSRKEAKTLISKTKADLLKPLMANDAGSADIGTGGIANVVLRKANDFTSTTMRQRGLI